MQLEKSLAAHVPTSALFATDSQSSSNDPCNVKSENNKSLTIIAHESPAAASLSGDTVEVLISSSFVRLCVAGAWSCKFFFSSDDPIATVTALQTGRSPY